MANTYIEKAMHIRVKHHHRKRHRFLLIGIAFFLFVAFLLQLLVALSLPIIKPVYLLSLEAVTASNFIPTSVATEIRFGVWGICATR